MEEIFEKDYEMVNFFFFFVMEILKIDKFAEFLKIRTIDDFFETFDEDNVISFIFFKGIRLFFILPI